MKKIIGLLFTLQLIVVVLYGLTYLRNLDFYKTFLEDRSMLLLNFGDNLESYDFFRELMVEKGIDVSQLMKPNPETIVIYATDVTLGGHISLVEGTFPREGTTEFISNTTLSEEGQVGLMQEVVMDLNLIVRPMNPASNVTLDGFYYLHTTDDMLLQDIVGILSSRLALVHLVDDIPDSHILRVLFSVHIQEAVAASTILQMREFIFIFPVITLCLLVSLVQYVSVKMKRATIFTLHGYGRKKILKTMTFHLIQAFFYSGLVTFLFSMGYLFLTNQMILLFNLIRYLFRFVIITSAIYLLLANGIMVLLLRLSSLTEILKGRKAKLRIQGFNHLIKCVFVGICLFQFVDVIHGLREFLPRIEALQHWE